MSSDSYGVTSVEKSGGKVQGRPTSKYGGTSCGGSAGGCWCDDLCTWYNDCCDDKTELCGYDGSCGGKCGGPADDSYSCWCDSVCTVYNDCCGDKYLACGYDKMELPESRINAMK